MAKQTTDNDAVTQHTAVHEDNHGKTPAAWVFSILMTVGGAIGCLCIPLNSWTYLWVGLALMLAGAVIGRMMSSAAAKSA